MLLFEDMQRDYMGFREPHERRYPFLNRSGRPEYEYTRSVLNLWFQDIPEEYQKALKTSFCAGDGQNLGAFFEIYCHALLKKQGFSVCLQQVMDQTCGNPVDFLAYASDIPLFYLEATVALDSDNSLKSQKQLSQLWEALNTLKEPSFRIIAEIEQESNHLPVSTIRKEIHQWLKALDPDEVSRKEDLLGRGAGPRYSWKHGGWHIDFIAMPRPLEERGHVGKALFYGSSSCGRWNEGQNALHRKLERKAKRYGTSQIPYIIAVDAIELSSIGCDLDEVFFGQEVILLDPVSGEVTQTRSTFLSNGEDGFWIGSGGRLRNQQVSAVLLVDELMPWSFTRRASLLWHNPRAENPLSLDTWQGPQMVLDEDKHQWVRYEGKSDWKLP